jgi:hypothetical protein
MSGSLYQLVSMDNTNSDMFNLTKKATENKLYTFNELNAFNESRRLRLNRDSDTIIPQYLIFNLNSNISSNDFINGLEMSNFKLLIGGNTIVDTLLSLYANLNPIKNIRNNSNSCSIIITIPFNITFDSINMLKLQYHEVLVELATNQYLNNLIDNLQLSCELTYLNQNVRREMVINNASDINIQEFESLVIKLDRPETEIKKTLDFSGISKGIFIESNNISNISNIKLDFNDIERYNYNQIMLELYSVKISPNLIYIPFDNSISYTNRNIESFCSGTNFRVISRCNISITFIESDININIHSIRHNVMRYGAGMGGLKYSYNYINTSNFNGFITYVYGRVPHSTISNNSSEIISWRSENKIISENSRNIECPITYEEIKSNDKYCECNECKYNILYSNLLTWFESRQSHSCPMCRTNWSNYIIYTNIN